MAYADSFDNVSRKRVLVEHVDKDHMDAMEALFRFFYTDAMCDKDKGRNESDISVGELMAILKLAKR